MVNLQSTSHDRRHWRGSSLLISITTAPSRRCLFVKNAGRSRGISRIGKDSAEVVSCGIEVNFNLYQPWHRLLTHTGLEHFGMSARLRNKFVFREGPLESARVDVFPMSHKAIPSTTSSSNTTGLHQYCCGQRGFTLCGFWLRPRACFLRLMYLLVPRAKGMGWTVCVPIT